VNGYPTSAPDVLPKDSLVQRLIQTNILATDEAV